MKLLDLELANYRKFKEAELAFGEGLIGIVGPNGVGKSSLIEAIAWAIFGQEASRTDKQLIPRQNMAKGQICQVILTLDINRKEYRIIRQLSGSNLVSKAAVFTKSNGVIEQIAKGTIPVEKFLTQLLGMDKNSFFTSFFAKQQELNALSDKQPAQRRKIILNMLGITNIDKAVDALRLDRRSLDNKTQLLESNQADSNFLKAQFQKLDKEYGQKKKELAKVSQTLKIQKAETAKKEKEVQTLVNKRDKYLSLSVEEQNIANEISMEKQALNNLTNLRGELTKDFKKQDKQSIKPAEQAGVSTIAGLDSAIQKLEEKENSFNKQISNLEKQKQAIAEAANLAKVKLKNDKDKLVDVQEKMQNLTEADVQSCPFCGQSLDKAKKEQLFSHMKNESGKIKTAFRQKETFIESSRQQYAQLDKQESLVKNELLKTQTKLANTRAQKNQLAGIEGQLSSLATQAKTKEKRLNTLKQQQDKVKKQIASLDFDESSFDVEITEAKAKTEKLHIAELEFKDFDKELSLLDNNRKQLKSDIEKSRNILQQLKGLNQEKKNLSHLEKLFLEFRKDLIGRIRPSLSKKASAYLNELTDGKYSRIELDNNYDIFVFDSGQSLPVERFSGGEKDLVNLCLRLAISELLTERASSEFNFLVLDEIFGSQDADRRDNILKALAKLSKKFRQLLVITHIDELKDSMELVISLKEENGTTIIEQN